MCCFPGVWVCVCFRSLWVSPMNSPVRLRVYPAAASTTTGVFNQRFEALFPGAGTLGCVVSLSSCSSQFICTRMWEHPVFQLRPCHRSSPPGCPSLPLLPVWMNVSSLTPWLSDFHTVRFSVSSGCFLFLKLLLSFFWLCEEAQCVHLHLHLGQKS